jgi:hypothetical protein
MDDEGWENALKEFDVEERNYLPYRRERWAKVRKK